MSRHTVFALALATLTARSAIGADEAPDPEMLSCATAYEQGQRLRKARHLMAARAQLVVCSDAACPAVLRDDCSRWLRDLDGSIPTVVLTARGENGLELSDVRVELDGKLLVTRLDGTPVQVDPGSRRFRFVRPDGSAVEKSVELDEGDRDQRVEAGFGGRASPAASMKADESSSIPTATWVLGGIGLAALGGFAYFALDGRSKKSDLDGCSPRCDPDQVDRARRSFLIGDIFLAVGVSALAGATVVYTSQPRPPSTGMFVSARTRF